MTAHFASLTDLLAHGFDTVIDVRSPAEFDEDHVPGAVNLPALSNAERAHVGTIYVQDAPFNARKVGAALVARNVAAHLDGPLAGKDGGWRALVYCWRGGQRSGSFTSILTQIGWRAEVLDGGYQSFRALVYDALYTQPIGHDVILLDGNTGTAKTDILHRLAGLGVQVLDLEGMANHRGSLLGAANSPQPAQKAFETQLACELATLDPARPVIIEAESSKIGARIIPPSLWSAMKAASRFEVEAPLDARARYLAQAYGDISGDAPRLTRKLEVLRRHRGNRVDDWLGYLETGSFEALAAALMKDHYDPTYRASRARHGATVLDQFAVPDLGVADREAVANRIAAWLAARRR